uniref:DOMON domain-containing protein n=1 Tax=Anopheles farauti TaxID=69004 RepID=A0A182Q743_9DIPT
MLPTMCVRRRSFSFSVASKLALLVLLSVVSLAVSGAHWDHAIFLDDDYRLLWSITGQDITFEVQARTHGYIGLGFSKDGTIYGADMVIGWVDQGQVHFQVEIYNIRLRVTVERIFGGNGSLKL